MSAPVPRVLLVEDSDLVTDALRVLLEATGHEVRVAASVRETLAACADELPDVMLLDLSLGDGHGLDALGVLRERATMPRIVAAMTGDDAPETRRRCLAAGCREVLVKPVGARDLVAYIRTWMDEPAA